MGVIRQCIVRLLLSVGTVISFLPATFAQEELTIERIDGDRFILHEVEPKQTLYAISKKYAVSIAEITKANPDINVTELKIGQVIKIPYGRDQRRNLRRNKVEIEGDTIYHTVLKKETLYSLSKRYKITVEMIEALNPEVAKDGLKEGATLVIPYTESPVVDEEHLKTAVEDSLIIHLVQPKETLYSISKTYKVSIDSIQMVNDGLKSDLVAGSTIRIPKKNPDFDRLKKQLRKPKKDTLAIPLEPSDTTTVALMLPFYLPSNDTLDTLESKRYQPYNVEPLSQYAIKFYQGFMLAVDSLRAQGHHFKLKVFDTNNDTNLIQSYLDSDTLNDVQLLIGPLYRSNFEFVADQLRDRPIGLVTPVKISSKVLLGRPNVAKVEASEPAQTIGMSKFIGGFFPFEEIAIVNSGRHEDQYHFELAEKYINQSLVEQTDSVRTINVFSFSDDRVENLFSDTSHTAVFIPSENQAYVTRALMALHNFVMDHDTASITVFGLDQWRSFTNLSIDQLCNLNVHVASQHYENYNDRNTVRLIQQFRTRFGTDPEKFGFLGFDVGHYFLNNATKYGAGCITQLPNQQEELLTTPFNFIKVGAESGYENSAVYILKYDDFELKRVH